MRKRLIAAMLLLALTLLPPFMWLLASRSFDMMMERERDRALSEEAAIARALILEIGDGSQQSLYAAASSAQSHYGSGALTVTLVRSGSAMAGAALPDVPGLDRLLATRSRATLLSGSAQTLFVAHALTEQVTLLTALDVSAVYAMRSALLRWAAVLLCAGMLATAVLACVISGVLLRPIRALCRAAESLRAGRYDAPLPRDGRDEIGELTRAFRAMSQALAAREEALREEAQRRQDLLDALAHEMRTPLTAIMGGARLMQSARLSPEEQGALLDTMAREALRLSEMDERLMLLTRLSHEEAQMTDFSSQEMAREALSVFEGVVLEGQDAVFHAQRELTITLLRNLVVNAQRAGGDEPVHVKLYPDGFDVCDRGCGMTQEQVSRAFEPFYRADRSRARAMGGAGLGLGLCLRIAQLHQGTLTIHSAPGEGTNVVYRFVTSL